MLSHVLCFTGKKNRQEQINHNCMFQAADVGALIRIVESQHEFFCFTEGKKN